MPRPIVATIKANMSKLIRAEHRDGVDYLVAPVVLITEGVHNNILYPAEELRKHPTAWNGSPLPLYHPTVNGVGVTANSPDVMENANVGMVFNVRFEQATNLHKARLSGEAWMDTGKLKGLAAAGNEGAKDLQDAQNFLANEIKLLRLRKLVEAGYELEKGLAMLAMVDDSSED